MSRYAYEVAIPNESMATLEWLAARGYDAGFYSLGTIAEETETHQVFSFTEPDAWTFNEASAERGFLTCCADEALIEALNGFINRIV